MKKILIACVCLGFAFVSCQEKTKKEKLQDKMKETVETVEDASGKVDIEKLEDAMEDIEEEVSPNE